MTPLLEWALIVLGVGVVFLIGTRRLARRDEYVTESWLQDHHRDHAGLTSAQRIRLGRKGVRSWLRIRRRG